ncbi:hypothetical protein ACFX5Q_34645 [Mesorhizobium sp. IMUNJ 23033]|uniref:hypothetical protein n=1 Tax=Mesorhizobium sp. IMUNJ 23033 TaxID=3378039 RepID=UPI00384F4F20
MSILNNTTMKADNAEAADTAPSVDNSTPTRKPREKSGVTVSVMVKKAKDEAPAAPTKADEVDGSRSRHHSATVGLLSGNPS